MDCTDAVLATVLVLSLGCYGNVLGSRSLMPPNGFHLVVQGDRLDVKLAELTVSAVQLLVQESPLHDSPIDGSLAVLGRLSM